MDDCAICLEKLLPGDCIKMRLCRHAFHEECIKGWLKSNGTQCPNCRELISAFVCDHCDKFSDNVFRCFALKCGHEIDVFCLQARDACPVCRRLIKPAELDCIELWLGLLQALQMQ